MEQEYTFKKSITRFLMIFILIYTLLLFLPGSEIRPKTIQLLSNVLQPIEFTTKPLITIFFGSIIMTTISNLGRYAFMNPLKTAEVHHKLKAYTNELKKYRSNINKMRKFQEENQVEFLKLQSEMMWPQLKSLLLTMFSLILIFGWLENFLSHLTNPIITLPWNQQFNLAAGTFFWILIYGLISIPLGVIINTIFKIAWYKRFLKNAHWN